MDAAWHKWEEGIAHLKEYVERHSDARVAQSHKASDGYSLGVWVNTQRTERAVMPRERVERLEAVAGWTWSSYDSRWEEGFAQLQRFVERTGHARVPVKLETTEGYLLGRWVSNQRSRESMPAERAARLEALPRWVWCAI